jgi:hypothetical protein
MHAVGKGMDSPGSERLIAAADRPDPRPLWVRSGAARTCSRKRCGRCARPQRRHSCALRGKAARLHDLDQDDSGPWIRKNFPGLFYIASPGYHAGGAYHAATWSGISGDRFHGRFTGADFSHRRQSLAR